MVTFSRRGNSSTQNGLLILRISTSFSPPGSIAEREHLKWKNAVDLPNNPYSAEALQRRISQTNQNRFLDMERLASKASTAELKPTAANMPGKPIKVILGGHQPDPVRFVCSLSLLNNISNPKSFILYSPKIKSLPLGPASLTTTGTAGIITSTIRRSHRVAAPHPP